MSNYKTLGIDTVTIGSYVPINATSGALETGFSNVNYISESPGYLMALTADAHAQGFKVVWNPGFTVDRADAPLVNSETAPGMNPTGFLNAVDQYWKTYAPLAQQAGVEMVVLGSEQTGLVHDPYTANWLHIIADARAVYSGKLTYSDITTPDGSGHLSIDAVKFWGALDYIGAENWMPLQIGGAANPFIASKGWAAMTTATNVPADLFALSQQYGKSIFFEAFGDKSDPSGWTDPAGTDSSNVIDLQAQYQFYKQFFETFGNASWVIGANAAGGDADWMPDTSVPGWNSSAEWRSGYSFLDKPAADVLKQYWLDHNPVVSIAPLVDLYIASFNRAPDADGLNYWATQFANGMSLPKIAESFFTQHEATLAYPAGQSTGTFVDTVYQNVLGRSADAGGLAYWTAQLQAGHVAKDTFLLALINGAAGTADATYLANKEQVGVHFAIVQGLNDSTEAKTVMTGVTSAAESVIAANHLTDQYAGHDVQILGIAS